MQRDTTIELVMRKRIYLVLLDVRRSEDTATGRVGGTVSRLRISVYATTLRRACLCFGGDEEKYAIKTKSEKKSEQRGKTGRNCLDMQKNRVAAT
jgi:hypothetical protein